MQALSDDLLQGAQQAADFMGLDRGAVYRLTAANRLPVIKKGRRLFYRKSDLERAFQAVA